METTSPTFVSYSPSLGQRLRRFTEHAKHWLQQALLRAAISLKDEGSLTRHAKRELLAAGYKPDDGEEGPNKWIQQNVLDLIAVFGTQGHSGMSASYCIDMFQKLSKYEPLVPLAGTPDEWNEVADGVYQNNRCSHVFKQADRFDGQPYDIEAVIFWEWFECPLEPGEDGFPGTYRAKTHFTSRESCRPITFPYTPKREYVEAPVERKTQGGAQ